MRSADQSLLESPGVSSMRSESKGSVALRSLTPSNLSVHSISQPFTYPDCPLEMAQKHMTCEAGWAGLEEASGNITKARFGRWKTSKIDRD